MTDAFLFPNGRSYQFLLNSGIKSFKIIKEDLCFIYKTELYKTTVIYYLIIFNFYYVLYYSSIRNFIINILLKLFFIYMLS